MAVIVAVDGGGSRCRLAAYDEAGDMLARVTVDEHASLSLGVGEAWSHIETGLRQLQEKMNQPDGWLPEKLMMGLAGSLQEGRRGEFLALLPARVNCTLVTDGHAQLMGASGGRPGICLAIGTGSVLHWLDEQGNAGMVGGWGFPAGDEGSGAWLGMRLVQHFLWHFDGRRQHGGLIAAAEERFGRSISAVQQWSTQSRSGVLATLAPLIFEHARQGDALAVSILHEACEHALALVNLAPAALPVHIVGGVGEQLNNLLVARLGERVVPAQGDALQGLWQLSGLHPGESM